MRLKDLENAFTVVLDGSATLPHETSWKFTISRNTVITIINI
jgi:hypothetical protein